MGVILLQLGRDVPRIITTWNAGEGASVLRNGTPLAHGVGANVGVLRIVRHAQNRFASSAFHECGHIVSHSLNWTRELATRFQSEPEFPPMVGKLLALWSPEIASDCFGFCCAGFGSIAGLHDVIDGDDASAFSFYGDDVHPISDLRLRIGVALCETSFGAQGPWRELLSDWEQNHPIAAATADVRDIIEQFKPLLPRVADMLLNGRFAAFNGRNITSLVDPERVSPWALQQLAAEIRKRASGGFWWWSECVRIAALAAAQAAESSESLRAGADLQSQLFEIVGSHRLAA
jgi:hypothetical protein